MIGLGKLDEILLLANKLNCNLLIFNHTLAPSQLRTLTNYLDEKIIDRNMLILDIFAQRAVSNDGKIQVELAQLKYMSTRLAERANALSRLTGGIGGRGPGESKLEVDKRRIEQRITLLTNKLKNIETKRNLQRKKRIASDSLIISLLGYTNVGKSTLLNRITKSNVIVEDKLFATLDTTSKSLIYDNKKLIISDTVGFIKELPKELFQAFKATIEEIKFSDLILHVIDPSYSDYISKIKSVNNILEELELINGKVLYVFNKIDLISDDELVFLKKLYPKAIFTSAKKDFNFIDFLENIKEII
jgi:GTP-binding protein HflX